MNQKSHQNPSVGERVELARYTISPVSESCTDSESTGWCA